MKSDQVNGFGLTTRELQFLKKVMFMGHFPGPAETDPYMVKSMVFRLFEVPYKICWCLRMIENEF